MDIPDIVQLQNEINDGFKNNDVNKKYILNSYLGKGSNSYVYSGSTPQNKIYVVKFIPRKENYNDIILEIGFLRALSLFPTSSKYINTCHDFSISQNFIIVVMNVFRGQNIGQFSNILKNLPEMDYMDMIKQIMKHSLKALSYVHKRGIAHQNIAPNNIVISCPDGKNIKYLKLVDFIQSCGYYYDDNTKNYLNKKCNYIVSRHSKFPPEYYQKEKLVNEIKQLMKQTNKDTIELYMAKKDDIWVLGTLLWCLVNRRQLGENPLSYQFPEKYQMNQLQPDYRQFRGTSELQKLHQFIIKYMLVPVHNRQSANDILNKFIMLEKYGWEYL
jgi:serine/threonine protein kinase